MRTLRPRRKRRRLFFRYFGENLGSVALCLDVVPDVFELAIRADKKGTSHDAEKRFAEECLHAARAVGFDRF